MLELTATEALAAIAAGDLRAETYAAILLSRALSLKDLNVLIAQDPDQVLEAARAADKLRARGRRLGPLHGLPLIIKDNINTATLPTTAGTPSLIGNRPRANARVVDALLGAGGIVFGKANMHELAFGITSNNGAFGPVRNPYDTSRIPGGSSGGNAAGVAARFAPAGIGTDTGGSTRIPAALCGVVGFRPTVGRYAGTGTLAGVREVVPIAHTRDTPGPIARSAVDVALLDAVITGEPLALPRVDLNGLRLGVARRSFFADLDPAVEEAVDEALRRLRDRGAILVEVEIPDLEALNAGVGFPVALFEAGTDVPVYLEANHTGVSLEELVRAIASPDVKAVYEQSVIGPGAIPESVYRDAIEVFRPQLQAAYRRTFEDFALDALVFPTTPLPARPIGQDQTVELNGRQVSTLLTYIRHTDPGSNAGIPGVSVPIGLTGNGLPVGLELDAAAGSDRRLLAIAIAVERVFGFLPAPRPERGSGPRRRENGRADDEVRS
ncbi:MAG: indoleacetamide hydrolase [Betaproteobacteria bacterium]|nr:MAG: indoleacetamide hydrolase [Betaproteobacteria bacterium]